MERLMRTVSALTVRSPRPLSRKRKNSAEPKLATMSIREKMTTYRMRRLRCGGRTCREAVSAFRMFTSNGILARTAPYVERGSIVRETLNKLLSRHITMLIEADASVDSSAWPQRGDGC